MPVFHLPAGRAFEKIRHPPLVNKKNRSLDFQKKRTQSDLQLYPRNRIPHLSAIGFTQTEDKMTGCKP